MLSCIGIDWAAFSGGAMSDQQQAIVARCQELGIDQHGLASIRNFIRAALFHVELPGTLPADKHLAYNTGIRHATNRITCRGRHGSSRGESRLLSRGAIELRVSIAADSEIERSRKIRRWMSLVTEEHQDPAMAIQEWIEKESPTVDDVVQRLLTHPPVIVTREEDKRIPRRFRKGGTPVERYRDAGIEPLVVEEGSYDFFSRTLSSSGKRRITKYHVPVLAFEA
jgi:hypothetical protein